MRKYIITITPVLKHEPLAAIVIDVSTDDVSVNYPKDAGIKVDSLDARDHFELCVKMPHDDKVLHLWYDSNPADTIEKPKDYEYGNIFRRLHSDIKNNLRHIPSFPKFKHHGDKIV
ncbi:MAG: hypothetical protein JSW26_25670 [Desulfobacterales bacterium]|nr:MAG: hypothetical protein JSW26_25670 [Desulfobacterales bacterium]